MKEVIIGTNFTADTTVSKHDTAAAVGSGEASVFSTPSLAALMENAAMNCAAQYLEQGETTVGTYIAIEHLSATPQGMKVCASATLTEQNGRELVFEIEAHDRKELVGRARHKRFVVLLDRFQAKAEAKKF